MPRVLIADSDPSTVFIAKRILTRDLGCSTVETDNGLDALHELSKQPFACLLLGVELAGLDAFETLNAVRAYAPTRDLPVVVLTADKSERAIRRLVENEVRHCLVKPLEPVRVSAKLRSLIDQGVRRSGGKRLPDAATALAQGAPLLVADADADFRHFFGSLFGSRYRVLSASSGAEALKLARATGPAVICAGDHLGPMDRHILTRKLFDLSKADVPVLLAVTSRSRVPEVTRLGVFDGVLTRTFVSATFRAQFEAIVGRPSPFPRLLGRVPDLRGHLISAVEQSCGMMGNLELEPVPTVCLDDGSAFSAVVDMAVVIDGEAIGMRCTLCASTAAARVMGAGMLGMPVDDLTDADLSSVLGELANIVTGRVQNGMIERGMPAKCGLPQITEAPGTPPALDPMALEAGFRIAHDHCLMRVDLNGTSQAAPQLVATLLTSAQSSLGRPVGS